MKASTKAIKQADPNLKVIEAKHWSKKSKPDPVDHDGLATGEICPSCGEEAFRFVNGVCLQCFRNGRVKKGTDQEIEKRAERNYVKKELQGGRLSLKDLKEGHY